MTSTDTARGWRRYSTNTLITAGLVVLALVLGVAAVAGTLALRRTATVTDTMVNRLSPARLDAERLTTALVDQETALRGYALAADPRFLEPYHSGRAAEAQHYTELRRLLAGRPEALAALDRLVQMSKTWRDRVAEPAIAAVEARGVTDATLELVAAGRLDFDRVRSAVDELAAEIDVARDTARSGLRDALRWQNTMLLGILVVFLMAAMLLTALIRAGVGAPVGRLAASTRAVSRGEFDRRIAVGGAADVRALAHDIETMRRRIVAELDTSVAAEAQLRMQAADLARSNADLARSNSELEQFAYVASHDLQEPLRKVASFCQLLERRYGELLDERGRQYVAYAVDGAERMQRLINDLLTFSRVGRVYDESREIDLEAAFAAAERNLATRIETTGGTVEHDPLPTVVGEPTLLTMLWQNLVGNGLKFHDPERAPRVRVTCRREGGEWQFAVTDNGIGIDPQYAEKIFIIFQRLHPRGDDYGGTGIGLAMCRKIVEHHGGRIWLDTEHTGPGTTIRFTLPAMEAAAEPEAVAEPEAFPEPETAAQDESEDEYAPERVASTPDPGDAARERHVDA